MNDPTQKAHFAAKYHSDKAFALLQQSFDEFQLAISFGKRSKRNTLVNNAEMVSAFIEGALRNLGMWTGSDGGGR